jgi:hypothetical protein
MICSITLCHVGLLASKSAKLPFKPYKAAICERDKPEEGIYMGLKNATIFKV